MAGLDLGRSINISLISSQSLTERKTKGDLLFLLQMIPWSYFYYQQRHRENFQDGGRIR